ncbi:MAG: sigma factor-like helix-turn-helix DNA-binding protein [Lysobacteraceae bacterium]
MKSDPERLALILRRRAEGHTLREIAADLGISRQRVHVLEQLARQKLLQAAQALPRGTVR